METLAICTCFIAAELCAGLFVARFCGLNHLEEDEE